MGWQHNHEVQSEQPPRFNGWLGSLPSCYVYGTWWLPCVSCDGCERFRVYFTRKERGLEEEIMAAEYVFWDYAMVYLVEEMQVSVISSQGYGGQFMCVFMTSGLSNNPLRGAQDVHFRIYMKTRINLVYWRELYANGWYKETYLVSCRATYGGGEAFQGLYSLSSRDIFKAAGCFMLETHGRDLLKSKMSAQMSYGCEWRWIQVRVDLYCLWKGLGTMYECMMNESMILQMWRALLWGIPECWKKKIPRFPWVEKSQWATIWLVDEVS